MIADIFYAFKHKQPNLNSIGYRSPVNEQQLLPTAMGFNTTRVLREQQYS